MINQEPLLSVGIYERETEIRGALIGRTHFGLWTDLAVLSAVAVVLLGVGSYFFSQIEV